MIDIFTDMIANSNFLAVTIKSKVKLNASHQNNVLCGNVNSMESCKESRREKSERNSLEVSLFLLRHKLLEKCLNKLKKMGLVGEWLRELWFYEISEEKSDVANGTTREKEGLNIWYFQWVYTAAPLEVIAMEDRIQKETMTRERVRIDNIDAIIESYITVAEED